MPLVGPAPPLTMFAEKSPPAPVFIPPPSFPCALSPVSAKEVRGAVNDNVVASKPAINRLELIFM